MIRSLKTPPTKFLPNNFTDTHQILANCTALSIATTSLTAPPYHPSLVFRIVQALVQLARAIKNIEF